MDVVNSSLTLHLVERDGLFLYHGHIQKECDLMTIDHIIIDSRDYNFMSQIKDEGVFVLMYDTTIIAKISIKLMCSYHKAEILSDTMVRLKIPFDLFVSKIDITHTYDAQIHCGLIFTNKFGRTPSIPDSVTATTTQYTNQLLSIFEYPTNGIVSAQTLISCPNYTIDRKCKLKGFLFSGKYNALLRALVIIDDDKLYHVDSDNLELYGDFCYLSIVAGQKLPVSNYEYVNVEHSAYITFDAYTPEFICAVIDNTKTYK